MKIQTVKFLAIISSSVILFVWAAVTANPNLSARASNPLNLRVGTPESYRLPMHYMQPVHLSHTADITFTPAFTSYLPLIAKPPAGIFGKVTYQGAPASGAWIQVWHCNVVSTGWACLEAPQYTTSGPDGIYQFTTAPTLGSDQVYAVQFYNNFNDSRYLYLWNSFPIYSYTAGQAVSGGDFDIADVTLLSPTDAITIGLPVTFQWLPRSATPSDSYQVELMKLDTEIGWYRTPHLGYVNSYVLNSLPADYTFDVKYGWEMWVYSPDGGNGLSRQHRTVTFSSTK